MHPCLSTHPSCRPPLPHHTPLPSLLQRFDASACRLEAAPAELAALPGLHEVDLSGNDRMLGAAGALRPLARAATLRRLGLRGCGYGGPPGDGPLAPLRRALHGLRIDVEAVAPPAAPPAQRTASGSVQLALWRAQRGL